MAMPNTQHASKWKITLSNIPSIGEQVPSNLYDEYIKGVTIPDSSITMINSDFMDYQYITPGTKGNTEYFQLLLEFAVSENLLNYFNFHKLLLMTRFEESEEKRLKDICIKQITVDFRDNQKRKVATMAFKNCFLTNISSLPLVYGSPEELSFTSTFNYQELVLLN